MRWYLVGLGHLKIDYDSPISRTLYLMGLRGRMQESIGRSRELIRCILRIRYLYIITRADVRHSRHERQGPCSARLCHPYHHFSYRPFSACSQVMRPIDSRRERARRQKAKDQPRKKVKPRNATAQESWRQFRHPGKTARLTHGAYSFASWPGRWCCIIIFARPETVVALRMENGVSHYWSRQCVPAKPNYAEEMLTIEDQTCNRQIGINGICGVVFPPGSNCSRTDRRNIPTLVGICVPFLSRLEEVVARWTELLCSRLASLCRRSLP